MPTRSQTDAQRALRDVEQALSQLNGEKRNRYTALAQRFPVMVRESGLLAAFAFLSAKAAGNRESPEGRLLSQIAGALGLEPSTLEAHLAGLELPAYLQLTRRALEVAVWYKRQAEAWGEGADA